MPDQLQTAIVVFARYPTPGKVKTRLAATIGNEAAANFYKACAEHVVSACTRVPNATCYVFYSATEDHTAVTNWLSPSHPSLQLSSQTHDPNLGTRLHHSLNHVLSLGHTNALVVGTDIPGMQAQHILTAVTALDTYQTVLGPADDGGYYLLGIQNSCLSPEVFEGIEWSTDMVLQQQKHAIERCSLSVAPIETLPSLADVDYIEDLQAWVRTVIQEDSTDGQEGGSRNDDVVSRSEVFRIARQILIERAT